MLESERERSVTGMDDTKAPALDVPVAMSPLAAPESAGRITDRAGKSAADDRV